MLEVADLTCGYGLATAVADLSFTAPEAAITALLGPNGAGKTSTVMAVAGHLPLRAGTLRWRDREIGRLAPEARTRLGLALVPEGRRIFPDLTVAENLLVGGYTRPRSAARATEARVYDLFPRLAERHRQRAGTLSGGEQQMLAIGRALMAEPRLLLVDELSLGLMPAMVDLCAEALLALQAQGVATLLVEQNTERALALAQEVVILNSGRRVYAAPAARARSERDRVEALLLGRE